MGTDDITHAATALAVHGLTALPPGTVEILGIKAGDFDVLGDPKLKGHWEGYLNPPTSHDSVAGEDDEGEIVSIERGSVDAGQFQFSVACARGTHVLMSVHNIERVYAPCEFGMAKCSVSLLHVRRIDASKDSMAGMGAIQFPGNSDGLLKGPDCRLLRLIPTRRDFPEEQSERIPPWLRQRRDGPI
eukprot:4994473-Pyramimonas_sp.AAC.1